MPNRIELTIVLSGAVLLGGCSSSTERGGTPVTTVALGEFAGPREPVTTIDTPPAINPIGSGTSEIPAPAITSSGEDSAATGRPTVPAVSRRLTPGDGLIVDSMIGQVNGKPIFADDFLRPIEDRLVAVGRRSASQSDFVRLASPIVGMELRSQVQNALLLAEAESELSVEQRQGLFFFLTQLRQETIAGKGGGTEGVAASRIQEEEDVSLDQYVEGLREEQLIRKVLVEHVAPRIIVSWRDVEREYDRRAAEFNPPGRVQLARIRLSSSRTEQVADVTARLDNGEDFLDIVDDLGSPSAQRGWQEFSLPDGTLASAPISDERLMAAVSALSTKGQSTGAISMGTQVWWIHVQELERPQPRSLYDADVQRQLRREIRSALTTEEQQTYVSSLLEDGIYDELDAMAQRLLAIALVRYGPA